KKNTKKKPRQWRVFLETRHFNALPRWGTVPRRLSPIALTLYPSGGLSPIALTLYPGRGLSPIALTLYPGGGLSPIALTHLTVFPLSALTIDLLSNQIN
ncbi:hypothetical protein, partial [Bacillus tuaregi]|uniref:hypothetical protein n=1 Tax=Bacillus tuaregi TaxID=1816695 RepID=UPI001C9CFEC9